MTTRVHLVLKSRNGKTGAIPVSTTEGKTCPPACPFFESSLCYAANGPLGMFWQKVSKGLAGMSWQAFCAAIAKLPAGTLWRHNQAGDLPGEGNRIDESELGELVAANEGKRGFTYTHKPLSPGNARAINHANENGFTINLSANSPKHADLIADKASALGVKAPIVTVLPHSIEGNVKGLASPAGRKIVVCPATYRDDVTCASCGLCAVLERQVIVGFPAHGVSAKKVSNLIATEGVE